MDDIIIKFILHRLSAASCLLNVRYKPNPAKCRKLSKAREARALHCSIIDGLLKVPREPYSEPHSSKETESATRDMECNVVSSYIQ